MIGTAVLVEDLGERTVSFGLVQRRTVWEVEHVHRPRYRFILCEIVTTPHGFAETVLYPCARDGAVTQARSLCRWGSHVAPEIALRRAGFQVKVAA